MRMRLFFLSSLLLLSLFCISEALADLKLPPPQTEGGPGLFDTLKKRASVAGGDLSTAEVRLDDLSTILWAATGLNRGEKGWTAPMARGLPPYVRLYVASSEGVFLYNWADHNLKEISRNNIKAKIGAQSFVSKAFYIIIFVSDHEILSAFKDAQDIRDFSQMATGAMSQNIYLAVAALNLGARYIHSIHTETIKNELSLPAGDEPIGLILLGK